MTQSSPHLSHRARDQDSPLHLKERCTHVHSRMLSVQLSGLPGQMRWHGMPTALSQSLTDFFLQKGKDTDS